MRVTLSYFIEPNPSECGWTNKYRFAFHGLRFTVRRPLEATENSSVSAPSSMRGDEQYLKQMAQDQDWVLGQKLRNFGSIHSDTWQGTAAARRDRVYPVLGCWKERPKLEHRGRQARYALIVSTRTHAASMIEVLVTV
ncbi:MAG TPA: hypothetical protein ENK04_06530 [Gammaproteobacteria bacterium]|nr:hypothetical protein [Gammaproteobacteria bacterium]